MVRKFFSLILKLALIFLLLLFLASHFSPLIHSFAVKYVATPSRNLYSAVCNILPIPVFEILAVAIVISAPFIIWRYLFGKGKLTALITVFQLIVIGYIITIGINGAIPPEEPVYNPTEAEMIESAERLANELNELSLTLPNGYSADFDDVRRVSGKYAREVLGVEYTHLPKIKSSIFSKLITRMDMLAYYSPVTAEVILNPDMPDFTEASSAMHELMHYFGVTREDDALYHAYRASRLSSLGSTRYSLSLSAFSYIGAELYRTNEAAYNEILANLSPRVKKDLEERQTIVYKNGDYNEISAHLNDVAISIRDERGATSYGYSAGRLIKAVLDN